ncbi:MAG TPA: hypothetical protein ENN07_02125 [candidate division Zixibacteria bacterium]|nr:hypothetical protein [candidate division Zixibacteria bacterium]
MTFRRFAILLAVLCFAAFGQLEMLGALPNVPEMTPSLDAGAWVEYKTIDAEGEASFFKFSILSQEEDDELYWFEIKATDSEGKWTIVKFKSSDPQDPNAAVSLVVQPMGSEPREMDFMLPANRPSMPGAETEEAEVEVPEIDFEVEKGVIVELRAGKFECDKYTLIDEDGKTEIWFSPDVPIAGVVKAVRDGKGVTELAKFGKDGAKSEIKGEPEKIEIPNLRQLMRQPE